MGTWAMRRSAEVEFTKEPSQVGRQTPSHNTMLWLRLLSELDMVSLSDLRAQMLKLL
jgi:hypothetical protein